jgi:hypothetical protein
MTSRTGRAIGWLAVTSLAFILGCGGSTGGSTVNGTVTMDGEPIEKGYISFYPENEQGTGISVGGQITKGKYSVSGITAGNNRVSITAAGAGRKSAKEAKEARSAKETPVENPVATATGNNQVVEVAEGTQTKDFQLTKGSQ